MKKVKMPLMQKLIQKVKGNLSLRKVLAEGEGDPTPTPTPAPTPAPAPAQPSAPTISFEQLIAQARKEEKDKLYPQITALKADKDSLTLKLNDALLQVGEKESKIQELTKELEKAQKGKADPEEIKTLKEKITALETENSQLKGEAEKAKLDKFKEAEIAKVNGEVIPELITGTTEEEITASIQVANARYKEIFEKAKGTVPATPQVPNSPAPANPVVGGVAFDFKTVTPEMIAGMSTQEYAKYRAQIGLK